MTWRMPMRAASSRASSSSARGTLALSPVTATARSPSASRAARATTVLSIPPLNATAAPGISPRIASSRSRLHANSSVISTSPSSYMPPPRKTPCRRRAAAVVSSLTNHRSRIMSPRLVAAVVPWVLFTVARAEEPKPLPPELRWIPADSVGFVHIRFAELWDSPAGKAMAAFIAADDMRTMATWERNFGVPMAQVDRLTVVLTDVEADSQRPGIVIRLTTREPYDRSKLIAAMQLEDRPDRPRILGGAKVLFRKRWDGEYVHLTDAKTITHFIGDSGAGLLARLLEGEMTGRLSPALEAAAKGNQLIAAVDVARLRDLPPHSVPEEFRPFLEARFAMIRGNLKDGGAELDLRATFANEDHARAARDGLGRVKKEILRSLERDQTRLRTTDENNTA